MTSSVSASKIGCGDAGSRTRKVLFFKELQERPVSGYDSLHNRGRAFRGETIRLSLPYHLREPLKRFVQPAQGRFVDDLRPELLVHGVQRHARRHLPASQARTHHVDEIVRQTGKGTHAGYVILVVNGRLKRYELGHLRNKGMVAVDFRDGH